MDDTPCNKGWCVGPTEAWAERDERIVEKGQKRDGAGRGWSLGFVSSNRLLVLDLDERRRRKYFLGILRLLLVIRKK